MKRPCKELKRMARETLNGRYSVPMGAFVTASVIAAAIEIPFSLSLGDYPTVPQLVITLLAEFLITLLVSVMTSGIFRIHMNMARNLPVKITNVFDLFKEHPERFIGANLIISLLELLAMIPFILGVCYFYFTDITATSIFLLVGASILSLIFVMIIVINYTFVYLFLLDYSEMKVTDAFKECRKLMAGNKGRFLYLQLSFLGWSFITIFSLGIASLWIQPYMRQAYVYFYMDCTGEADQLPAREYSTASTGFPNSVY